MKIYSLVKSAKDPGKMPIPASLSYMWNMGSLLGFFLVTQICTGLLLASCYMSSADLSFGCLCEITRELGSGWVIRGLHMNGASFYFIFIYLHILRGLFYKSYKFLYVWVVGSLVYLMSMMTAFFGYILPWGQMSYWGATVITNLGSVLPNGAHIVQWIWGNFIVESSTLMRFFTLHYLGPFLILFLVGLHIFFLHQSGSSNPLGVSSKVDSLRFYKGFYFKDLFGIFLFLFLFLFVSMVLPLMFSDSENFNKANSLSTPTLIKPEWYFLFAYAILRSFTNKTVGVVALLLSVVVLFFLPLTTGYSVKFLMKLEFFKEMFFFFFLGAVLFLSFLGSMPVDPPYSILSLYASFMYFMYFIMLTLV